MYPLLLNAALKDSLWGGNRLADEFGFNSDSYSVGEAAVFSCQKNAHSTVRNGELNGLTLQHAIEVWGPKALGVNAASFTYFPIQINLIDAKDRLSLSVNPADEYAILNGDSCGGTKMWYIVDCVDDAKLIYGFKQDISKGEFLERINNNNLSPVCNYVPVKKGDVFFIDAGTMHAMGKGILAVELKQNCETKYRISDYGRLGADGKPRKLNIKQALDVTQTKKPTKPYGAVGDVTLYPFGTVRELANYEYFCCELIHLDGNVGLYDNNSFISLLFLDGSATLSYAGGTMKLKKGDSVFLPAGVKVRLTGTAQIMHTHL